MTTLFVIQHGEGLKIFTSLDNSEAKIVGDVRLVLDPGEGAFGLDYDDLAQIASTTGKIDSQSLPANDFDGPVACIGRG